MNLMRASPQMNTQLNGKRKLFMLFICFQLLTILGLSQFDAYASSEVSAIAITKVEVGYKRITFNMNPSTYNGSFVRDYEVGFKGHYDKSDYGDPSSFCNISPDINIRSAKTVISCVVDLSSISNEVLGQITAKGVLIDWVIRGNFEGTTGDWSKPYSLELYKYPQFLKKSTTPKTVKESAPTGALAKCRDGSYSFQSQHKGACSRHGGVAQFYK
jgi:Protein of unknown function (DUF3761)